MLMLRVAAAAPEGAWTLGLPLDGPLGPLNVAAQASPPQAPLPTWMWLPKSRRSLMASAYRSVEVDTHTLLRRPRQ